MLIQLQTDPALYKMLTLGEQEANGGTRNLSVELASARATFRGLAEHIRTNSSRQRSGKAIISIQDDLDFHN